MSRKRHLKYAALVLGCAARCAHAAQSTEPPAIPVGADAYRMWERWPYQRIGMRTYMRSTFDRTGGNEGADASHFLYQVDDTTNVSLDIEGAGILDFARFNHWHGSPWHYTVDGTDHVIRETSTADPLHPVEGSTFIPEELFPKPLAWTWADTRGADLSWVPVPFEKSFRMAYERTHYGTGYYIYSQFVPGTKLSRPLKAWDGKTPPDKDMLDLLSRAGTDITPRRRAAIGQARTGTASLPASGEVTMAWLHGAPAMVRALEFSVPKERAVEFGRARLRVTWDGRKEPSIDAPVALFFGAGTLYNRDDREYLVKALPVSIRYDKERVHLACYFPMPFFKSATFMLANAGEAIPDVRWSVRVTPFQGRREDVGYFHATYRDHPHPERGHDLVLLDTRETEGGGDWSGHLVGTSFIFSHNAVLNTLEGDPRFFFDDSSTPQAQGTGTEEWGGGGDYWGGRTMTLPLAGHPVGAPGAKEAKENEDKIESAYRFLLADMFPFGRNARIGLEHGGVNDSTEHYETVAYWYGAPAASLIQTDTLDVGDSASEKTHRYVSPDASKPYDITSRYEWGPDTLDGVEIFPATHMVGRTTTGTSEFTLRLRPDNWGVLLRRTLDYSFPNQRAEVEVAPVGKNGKVGAFKPAGAWYLAGSNTVVYSNPPGEMDPARHVVQTSNRRFRDDEFLVPRALTRGQKAIRVRVHFTPVNRSLFPGHPLPEPAWSEIRYHAYCYVTPRWR